eukprot:GHVN01090164.1.p1 GENE.GHVN01090164.1~~GHVN01090164.1.p1  ORF type:complete len:511 (+),score=45.37 GHVN01090164.1:1618-3150(+)
MRKYIVPVVFSALVLLFKAVYDDIWYQRDVAWHAILSRSLAFVVSPFLRSVFTVEHLWRGRREVDGARNTIKIHKDGLGIPYIFAENDEDAFFGLGYAHALDRTWQMVSSRLACRGALSQHVGIKALTHDKVMRSLNLTGGTVVDNNLWKAYAAGVTEGLSTITTIPFEMKLLGIDVLETKWTVEDSDCIARMNLFYMSRGWTWESASAILENEIGSQKSEKLRMGFFEDAPFVLHRSTSLTDINNAPIEELQWAKLRPTGWTNDSIISSNSDDTPLSSSNNLTENQPRASSFEAVSMSDQNDNPLPYTGTGVEGSNAWAVGGQFTRSGRPVLAGDPHLEGTAPSFVYPSMLTSTQSNGKVIGGSVPGIPVILFGHNRYAAWSMTLSYNDVDDLFEVELVNGGKKKGSDVKEDGLELQCDQDDMDLEMDMYQYDGKLYPLELRQIYITVRDLPRPISYVVRSTHHGPLLSDVMPELKELNRDRHFKRFMARGSPSSQRSTAIAFASPTSM